MIEISVKATASSGRKRVVELFGLLANRSLGQSIVKVTCSLKSSMRLSQRFSERPWALPGPKKVAQPTSKNNLRTRPRHK